MRQNSSSTAIDIALLVLRIGLGIIFFAHGAQKALGWWGGPGMQGTVGFMTGMGLPIPLPYLAVAAEFLGGMGLILGVLPRISALGILVTMLVAMTKVHLANGFFLGKEGNGIEFTLALSVMALTILIAGPGRFALINPKKVPL